MPYTAWVAARFLLATLYLTVIVFFLTGSVHALTSSTQLVWVSVFTAFVMNAVVCLISALLWKIVGPYFCNHIEVDVEALAEELDKRHH